MLLEEILKNILGEQTHNLAEILGQRYLANMADDVVQPVLGDVWLLVFYPEGTV